MELRPKNGWSTEQGLVLPRGDGVLPCSAQRPRPIGEEAAIWAGPANVVKEQDDLTLESKPKREDGAKGMPAVGRSAGKETRGSRECGKRGCFRAGMNISGVSDSRESRSRVKPL